LLLPNAEVSSEEPASLSLDASMRLDPRDVFAASPETLVVTVCRYAIKFTNN